MRVTAETKTETRRRILEAARRLFADRGYEASTTRDLAEAAGIANGTLFNYFAGKEAILACLAADATAGVDAGFQKRDRGDDSFEEELFAFVAAGLRKLKPWREHLPVVLDTALNPLTVAPADDAAALRVSHLETVAGMARRHGLGDLPGLALQLYWTLYTGVLVFWARDGSPRQEDTLALLDSAIAMFVGWLQRETDDASADKKGGAEPCPRR